MIARRTMRKGTSRIGPAVAAFPSPAFHRAEEPQGIEVNDVQSNLNSTRVRRIIQPDSLEDLRAGLRLAQSESTAVSVAGGRHSMGGQQFARDTALFDMTRFDRVVNFDRERGLIEVEAGIEWPELFEYLGREQPGVGRPWAIRQKQTGVDRVTIGGSLSSNIHGRGLRFPPFVSDIESFVLMDARGDLHACSRQQNAELFSLAIGGYGLFGLIVYVTLRLTPRHKVRRVVDVIPVKDLISRFDERLDQGFEFGDCQYATDLEGDAGSHPGVFACYQPADDETPIPAGQRQLTGDDWAQLYKLARTDKKRAFERYSNYYLSTSGQAYWSDAHQRAGSFEGYRKAVDATRGTEMITEVYVNRDRLVPFLAAAREDFVRHGVDMTYGTIRFIERDAETFLAWAREPSVCIVCNLHVIHSEAGKRKAADDFRRIIDRAIEYGGRYYLTYHRWATRKQVETCYPQFVEFLRLKKRYDPQERFQSDWYRHYREMFADRLLTAN